MSAFEDILNEQDDETIETVETPVESTEPVIADEPTAESPTPEQAASAEPVSVAEEAQPITREDGAVWSENAKRWYLGGKIVAGEAPALPEPSIPSVPAPVAAVEAPKVEAPIGEPWTVRGAGQKHQIPGAVMTADGKLVVEGPENIARHRDIVAAGIQHLTNYGREKQEWTQRIQQAEAAGQAKATLYNRVAADLFDKISDDNWLQALIENPHREREFLRRELALSLEQAKLAMPAPSAQQESQPEDIEAQFGQTMTEYLTELVEDAPKGILSPEDIADMRQTFGRRMAAYAAEVDGQIMLDTHAMKADFEREIKLVQRAQQQAARAAADAQKAKAAAAYNAANTPKAPPAPTKARVNPVPAGTAASTKAPATWDQRVRDVWRDDDDE